MLSDQRRKRTVISRDTKKTLKSWGAFLIKPLSNRSCFLNMIDSIVYQLPVYGFKGENVVTPVVFGAFL